MQHGGHKTGGVQKCKHYFSSYWKKFPIEFHSGVQNYWFSSDTGFTLFLLRNQLISRGFKSDVTPPTIDKNSILLLWKSYAKLHVSRLICGIKVKERFMDDEIMKMGTSNIVILNYLCIKWTKILHETELQGFVIM
jgi:hypothetical protein